VKAYRSLTVRPRPPAALAPLERLIRNMRWTWHPATRDLFEEIDPEAWRRVGRDPLRLLGAVPVQRLEELAADEQFLDRMRSLDDELTAYLQAPGWFSHRREAAEADSGRDGEGAGEGTAGGDVAPVAYPDAVAYFSMEFGISDVLPNFSGGLGVLAGDHLKSASDLGVPIIAVGLFYRFGYFSQTLSPEGWQQEVYAANDPHSLIMERAAAPDGTPLAISVDMPDGKKLHARIWLVRVGRIPLLLLDSDIEANDDGLRQTTDRLYGGDQDHRIRQEILLGVGGVRAVRAYCEATGFAEPEVFHMNEGHAGFSGLERMRTLVAEHGLAVPEALAAVRAGTVFTTHTPVPAGIDRFPVDLVRHYLDADAEGMSRLLPGIPAEEVVALGAEDDPGRFNMAHLGLRLAQRANGVAKLHGAVSRRMFAGLYPGYDESEVPIGSVTNGVHLATWQDRAMRPIAEQLADSADLDSADNWGHTERVDSAWLWQERCRLRGRLVDMARQSMRTSWLQRGLTVAELGWTETILDPDILTIGFARRVSTYKRLTLMLRDRDRLKSILLDPDRPVQIVIAGKAHPADDGGKHFMQEMVAFADDPEVRHRVAFLPNYSMSMASVLCAGADVWLNNPIRPQEASGTSGMKAALNGALNLSISDGWWDELYDGHDGWVIPSVDIADEDRRDDLEAAALYDLLADRVVPLFYQRGAEGRPDGWIDAVRHALSYLGPRVQATRMVRDYVQDYYAPATANARVMRRDWTAAKDFAAWQDRVRSAWPGIRITGVDVSGIDTEPALGHPMTVRAYVDLGGLSEQDVQVQTVMGRLGEDQQLTDVTTAPMRFVGNGDGHRFQVEVPLDRAGSLGYTVRVLPAHPLLVNPAEMGLVATPQD
jgi:starch phosphorylase